MRARWSSHMGQRTDTGFIGIGTCFRLKVDFDTDFRFQQWSDLMVVLRT